MSDAKVCIITGGASGMGLATSKGLAKKGWKVSIVDMNAEAGQAAADEIDGMFTKANITIYDELANAFAKTWEKYGRLDFVFANAGVERFDFHGQQSSDDRGLPPPPDMFASNVMFDGAIKTVYLGQHFLRKNSTPGGSIIMLASSGGIYASAHAPLYSASKHGVVGFVRGVALKLAGENIHVSCICPGNVSTGLMTKERFDAMSQDTFTPLPKIVSVVEMLLERKEETRGAAVEVIVDKAYLRWRQPFCEERMEKCWNSLGGTSPCRELTEV